MSVTVQTRPPKYHSAYKPNTWSFASDKYPNTIPGESNIPIAFIFVADAPDLITYPTLAIGDVCIIHAITTPGAFAKGQQVKVEGCSEPVFNGTWRVTQSITDGLTVIDCDAGAVTGGLGGTITKVYERYRVVVDVTFDSINGAQRYILDPDANESANLFYLDVRNQAQRSFGDVFQFVTPGTFIGALDMDGRIANQYSITVGEAYNVPDPVSGVNTYIVTFKDVGPTTDPQDSIVLNSVQPYHHYNEWDGDVDLTWNDDLSGYVVNPTAVDDDAAKLLTYFPGQLTSRGAAVPSQSVGVADSHYLASLVSDKSVSYGLKILQFDENNSPISSTTEYYFMFSNSLLWGVGPANLSISSQAILPATALYIAVLVNEAGDEISRRYHFTIDRRCHPSPVRIYALNKFGAIDAFTFIGYDKRENKMDIDTVSKPSMPMQILNGDYQRKAWRVKPERTHATESETLPKAMLRYVADEIMESSDMRTKIADGIWTPVIYEGKSIDMGFRTGSISFEYSYGVDQTVQTR